MQDVPLLLVVSYRDDQLGPWHPVRVLVGELGATRTITRVQLAPLSASAVATMAEPFGADAEELYRRTGGNPFFVTELLPDHTGMPETVADAVLARAARLEPPTREALEAVAVVGPSAERWILNLVLPDAEERLDEAVTAGLLRASREEVYSVTSSLGRPCSATGGSRQKPSLHRAALDALRSGSWASPTTSASHTTRIGAGDPAQILEIVPRAAVQASGRGAHREAAVLYEQAVRFADALSLEQQATLFSAMSLELFNVAEFEPAAAAQRQALACYEQLGDELSRGAAGTWLAQLAWQAGSLPQALQVAEAAVAASNAFRPATRCWRWRTVSSGTCCSPPRIRRRLPSNRNARPPWRRGSISRT